LIQIENQTVKFNYKPTRYKESLKDGTRRRWFQILSKILQAQEMPITKEVLGSFHESMKESMFDCEKFIVDGKEIVVVPSINAVPDQDVKNANENLIARYSQLGIDFSDIL